MDDGVPLRTWFLSCLRTTLLEDSVLVLSTAAWASRRRALVRRRSLRSLENRVSGSSPGGNKRGRLDLTVAVFLL